jgi:hypothetical protein
MLVLRHLFALVLQDEGDQYLLEDFKLMVLGITERILLLWSEIGEDALKESDPSLVKVFEFQLLLLVFFRIELERADLYDNLLSNRDQLLILFSNANIGDQIEECFAPLDYILTLVLTAIRVRRLVKSEQEGFRVILEEELEVMHEELLCLIAQSDELVDCEQVEVDVKVRRVMARPLSLLVRVGHLEGSEPNLLHVLGNLWHARNHVGPGQEYVLLADCNKHQCQVCVLQNHAILLELRLNQSDDVALL